MPRLRLTLMEEHQHSDSETMEAAGTINESNDGGVLEGDLEECDREKILQNVTTLEDHLLEVGTSADPSVPAPDAVYVPQSVGKSLTQQRASRKRRATNITSHTEEEHNKDMAGLEEQDQLEDEDKCKSHASSSDLEDRDKLPNWRDMLSKKAPKLSKKQERRIAHLVKIQAFRQGGLGWKLAKLEKMPKIVARHWAWWKVQQEDMRTYRCKKSFLELKRLAKTTGPKGQLPLAKPRHKNKTWDHSAPNEFTTVTQTGVYTKIVKNVDKQTIGYRMNVPTHLLEALKKSSEIVPKDKSMNGGGGNFINNEYKADLPHSKTWLDVNAELFAWVGAMVRLINPKMYLMLENHPWLTSLIDNNAHCLSQQGKSPRKDIKLRNLAGIFTSIVINKNQTAAGKPHRDTQDVKTVFKVVVPWGTFGKEKAKAIKAGKERYSKGGEKAAAKNKGAAKHVRKT
ncbi:hypothetical protein DFH27DRAFT_614853 [Peziza echinospora]|nr:hypothetical protein DFH27DRAFT_614853 [Peziza echinospora]